MPPIFIDYPPSNGGSLLLVGTTVVVSYRVGVSFWVGEDVRVLS